MGRFATITAPRSAWSCAAAMAIGLAAATGSVAQEQPVSAISVPVTIPLPALESYVDAILPSPLHAQQTSRTCVEPQQACTKVPEFRGFEVTMKNRCVEVTPRIDCTITERVERVGGIAISGAGEAIILMQRVRGSGTVRGQNDVVHLIRETVTAAAELTITARPQVLPDWTPLMPVEIAYRWIERPQFQLFNIFTITIGSHLGPPLDAAIADFTANRLPAEIAKIDLRTEAERLWQALHVPVPLELRGGGTLFLHAKPLSVGLEGPRFDGGALRARLGLTLAARITPEAQPAPASALPDLGPLPDDGLRLVVPVSVPFDVLNPTIKAALPVKLALAEGGPDVTVRAVHLSGDGGRLVTGLMVQSDVIPGLVRPRPVIATAEVALDGDDLVLTDISLRAGQTGFAGLAVDGLLTIARGFMDDTLRIVLTDEIAGLEEALAKALDRELAPGLRLAGAGEIGLGDLEVGATGLTFVLTVDGEIRVEGYNPMRN